MLAINLYTTTMKLLNFIDQLIHYTRSIYKSIS